MSDQASGNGHQATGGGSSLPVTHHSSLITHHSHPILVVLAIAAALLLPWVMPSAYGMTLLNQALIYILIVLGLNFVYGFGGIFSLAQAAFWGIGAYTSALLTTDGHMGFLVALIGAALVTSLFGVILGVPTLKLRSHYLTMATLAFAEVVRQVLMNAERLTHGAAGIRGIPPAALGSLTFDTPQSSYYLGLALVLATVLFTVRFRRSRLGRALEATRDDELAAGSSGVNVTYARVLAFVLSALLAGVAGSLWAHFSAYISPETFDLFGTIRFVSMLLIGGAGTALGPIAGALLLTYLPEWLRFLESYYMAIYGLSIVLILVFAPRGLVGLAIRVMEIALTLWTRGRNHQDTKNTKGHGEGERGLGTDAETRRCGDTERDGDVECGGLTPLSTRRLDAAPGPLTPNPQPPTPVFGSSLVSTSGLTMAFGGLVAVKDVTLSVAPGEIRGVIGPNGSGKTTLLNLVSGIYRPLSGEIRLGDERIDGRSPAALVEKGIARTFQNIRLFPRLTVLDNVKVGMYCRTRTGLLGTFLGTPGAAAEERKVEEAALGVLEYVGLAHRAADLPGDLPYGQQRLVEVARALATRPRLLLLDEPAAGMSLGEKQLLVRLVQGINLDMGIAVLVIEHDMRIISGLCHRVTVLNFGEVIAEGTPREVRDDDAVIEAYLGRRRRRARTG